VVERPARPAAMAPLTQASDPVAPLTQAPDPG
jgi:hypothetical protein